MRRGGELWMDISLGAQAAHHYSGTTVSLKDVTEILCKVLCVPTTVSYRQANALQVLINSNTLMTSAHEDIGLFLDARLARMNHSCDYNASIWFTRYGEVAVYPLRDIQKGDEITIQYVDCNANFEVRQSGLRGQYFFEVRQYEA